MGRAERLMLVRLEKKYVSREPLCIEGDEAVLLSKLIAVGYASEAAFTEVTNRMRDETPSYRTVRTEYPLTAKGYAHINESWWDRTVDHWLFRVVRDSLALIGGIAVAWQFLRSVLRG